jgi:hypothetical protein
VGLDWIVYYVEHLLTSFLGVLVLCLSGRFDPLQYASFPLPVSGYHLFCIYMRFFLMPLSWLTWANLNHTLCGIDNDPFYRSFKMGKWYYFWADWYLMFSCYVGIFVNLVICFLCKWLLSVLGWEKVKHE